MIGRWYEQNVMVLRHLYGRVIYDNTTFKWLGILCFGLPPTFKESITTLLITTPGADIDDHEGYKFYIDLGLIRTCQDREEHIFENSDYNDLYHAGYARLSFHLEQFHPAPNAKDGDNLAHVVQSVYNFLGQRW